MTVCIGLVCHKPLEGGQELIQEWWNKYGLPLSDRLEEEKYNQAARDAFGLTNETLAH